jgi:hypothetical protein
MANQREAHLKRTSIGFSAFLKAFRPWAVPLEIFPALAAVGFPGAIAIASPMCWKCEVSCGFFGSVRQSDHQSHREESPRLCKHKHSCESAVTLQYILHLHSSSVRPRPPVDSGPGSRLRRSRPSVSSLEPSGICYNYECPNPGTWPHDIITTLSCFWAWVCVYLMATLFFIDVTQPT